MVNKLPLKKDSTHKTKPIILNAVLKLTLWAHDKLASALLGYYYAFVKDHQSGIKKNRTKPACQCHIYWTLPVPPKQHPSSCPTTSKPSEKQALIGPRSPRGELEDFCCTNQKQMSAGATLKEPAVLDGCHMLLIQRLRLTARQRQKTNPSRLKTPNTVLVFLETTTAVSTRRI